MILTLLLALSCTPTPATDDGCAGYCFTPTETLPRCEVRYALDYVSAEYPTDPEYQPTCETFDIWYVCRYWSRFVQMSCACFDNESPPLGQIWMRAT